jgi:leucyl-tRNA synthetase
MADTSDTTNQNGPGGRDDRSPHRYTAAMAREIESRWQSQWETASTFHSPNPDEPGFDASRPKKFILDMFPYPSGVGLHVGHPLGYIATDIYARYLRMTKHNVLHAMGYDAFGLPAEQYAIQTGQHPRITTENNIATMRAQMRRLGLAHDPKRTFATTDVGYYKWTQWIFLQIFNAWYDEEQHRARHIDELPGELAAGRQSAWSARHNPADQPWAALTNEQQRDIVDERRLAFVDEVPVNWCPGLGTVLANEEVTAEGRSERGNFPVFKRPLKQWMMRITKYCDRLLEDLEDLDWPEPIKLMQRNWIGRSEGADVDFLALRDGADPTRWFEARKRQGWTPGQPPEEETLRVFTTRPDTLYGATYMVLAPEHPLVEALTADDWPADAVEAWKGQFPGRPDGDASPADMVAAYRAHAAAKTDVERQEESREKTGVFIGAYAVNPVNHERIPIFIADYVLMGYGTGAIMAVPAHDERDFEFAKQFHLPIRPVVMPDAAWLEANVAPNIETDDELIDRANVSVLEAVYQYSAEHAHDMGGLYEMTEAYSEYGKAINSPAIDGQPTSEAKPRITAFLEEQGLGRASVNFRLRDWLFSRQRYWGEPFPILFDESGRSVAVDEGDLPVELPELTDYRPMTSDDPDAPPTTPLARAEDWVRVERGGVHYTRELNTMPNWAGSCWYYLRYLDAGNDDAFVDPNTERYWMLTSKDGTGHPESYDRDACRIGGVDLYVGGAEHAVLHLLYARFWHKILFDLGHVSTPEPFHRLFNQGYVQAHAYTDDRGVYVEASEVEERDGQFFHEGKPLNREYGKMGKSLKNAVTPDEICEEYGADTLRLYEMYMGPLEASKPWNTRDIIGVFRFLQRFWRAIVDEKTGEATITDDAADDELRRALHKTIQGVHDDMESLGFNTAIAKLIELNNKLTNLDRTPREVAEGMVRMIAPFAPHFAEELWSKLGHGESIAYAPFPEADPDLLVDDTIEIPVMVKGRVRAKIHVPPDTDPAGLEAAAMSDPKVVEFLEGKEVRKVIAVPKKMVNIVI